MMGNENGVREKGKVRGRKESARGRRTSREKEVISVS